MARSSADELVSALRRALKSHVSNMPSKLSSRRLLDTGLLDGKNVKVGVGGEVIYGQVERRGNKRVIKREGGEGDGQVFGSFMDFMLSIEGCTDANARNATHRASVDMGGRWMVVKDLLSAVKSQVSAQRAGFTPHNFPAAQGAHLSRNVLLACVTVCNRLEAFRVA